MSRLYNTRGHKLRIPSLEKAQFLTVTGIVGGAARYQHQFAVLMIDLDGFKAINDTYGHCVGDEILRKYAQFLSRTRRSSDFLARYGGDELMMILPETTIEAVSQVTEQIKITMTKLEISLPGGSRRGLSVTGGIAMYPTHAQTASDLLRASSEALYRAKRQNRGAFLLARLGLAISAPQIGRRKSQIGNLAKQPVQFSARRNPCPKK